MAQARRLPKGSRQACAMMGRAKLSLIEDLPTGKAGRRQQLAYQGQRGHAAEQGCIQFIEHTLIFRSRDAEDASLSAIFSYHDAEKAYHGVENASPGAAFRSRGAQNAPDGLAVVYKEDRTRIPPLEGQAVRFNGLQQHIISGRAGPANMRYICSSRGLAAFYISERAGGHT